MPYTKIFGQFVFIKKGGLYGVREVNRYDVFPTLHIINNLLDIWSFFFIYIYNRNSNLNSHTRI